MRVLYRRDMTDVDALLAPPTPVAACALDVVREWSSPALSNHCLRSWAWASLLSTSDGIEIDRELLFVAAMLHDLGVTPSFDAHAVPFEQAGGAVAAVFAAGVGWDAHRRGRVAEIIERHMWRSVDVAQDPEGHLLEVATSLDVSGVGFDRWDASALRDVTARVPRLDFSTAFDGLIHEQAGRKPGTSAVRLDGSGRVAEGGRAWDAFLA